MDFAALWKEKKEPTISFELFPVRDDKARTRLGKAIDKLVAVRPDFVSVTFGAGGTTRQGSFELAKLLGHEKQMEVLPYFAGFGMGPDDIRSTLNDYQDLGISNILVVRGDKPGKDSPLEPHPDSFSHGSDLLGFIRPEYDFCLGAGGYPEGHVEAISLEKDMEYLKLKVANGAQFIITNYFFDNQFFYDFSKRCKAAEIHVPIIPGIMPIFNVKIMKNLANLCGATIPRQVSKAIDALPPGDKAALHDFGVEFALDQCRSLINRGVPGLHFYTIDRAKSVVAIVKGLRAEGLLPK